MKPESVRFPRRVLVQDWDKSARLVVADDHIALLGRRLPRGRVLLRWDAVADARLVFVSGRFRARSAVQVVGVDGETVTLRPARSLRRFGDIAMLDLADAFRRYAIIATRPGAAKHL